MQFTSSERIFSDDVGGFPTSSNPYIFNGDMVDRGKYSLEILLSLLTIKLADPEAVHILRGNHETDGMYQDYGFRNEVLTKYDYEVFMAFENLFDCKPNILHYQMIFFDEYM